MDDTILEGLSPSTNSKFDTENGVTKINKTSSDWVSPSWANNRWNNIKRDYTINDVEKLKGSIKINYTLAENGAKKLWKLLHTEDYVNTCLLYTSPSPRD